MIYAKAYRNGTGEPLYGSLSFEGGEVLFSSEGAIVRIDLSETEFYRDRRSNHFVFRSRGDGTLILTESHRLLKEPALLAVAQINRVIRAYRIERTFWIIRILAVSIALFGVVGYSGLFLIKKTGALLPCITDRIPIEIEDSIGEGIVREMEPQIIHDPILDVTIEPLLKSLIAANGLDPSIRYHIIGNTEVNAYAIPGRRILLNTGLLALCDTPDQIAGIIAHEAAHIQKKHILRQIISSAGLLITAQILLSSGELANILLESGSELLRMKFSRDFEREADMTGVDYLKRASIPVAGFYRIMKKIGEASEGGDIPVILNTHPDTDERLAEIKKYAGGGRDSYKKIDRSFYIFKKKIDEYNSIRTEQSAD